MSNDITYIKLIAPSSGLWPSFDPTIPVELGDYGKVDPHSLAFNKEGNIFAEDEINDRVTSYGVGKTLGKDYINECFSNENVRVNETDNRVSGDVGIVGGGLKLGVKFKKGGAALLVLHNVRTSVIDKAAKLKRLRDDGLLQKKVIVTQVKECDSFFLTVGRDDECEFEVEAKADVDIGPIVGATADADGMGPMVGAKAGYHFVLRGSPQMSRSNTSKGVFYPLFKLERVPHYFWQGDMKQVRRGDEDEGAENEELDDPDDDLTGDSEFVEDLIETLGEFDSDEEEED